MGTTCRSEKVCVLSDFLKLFKAVAVTDNRGRQTVPDSGGHDREGVDQQTGSLGPCHEHIEKPATPP